MPVKKQTCGNTKLIATLKLLSNSQQYEYKNIQSRKISSNVFYQLLKSNTHYKKKTVHMYVVGLI